jgi:Chlorophyllase
VQPAAIRKRLDKKVLYNIKFFTERTSDLRTRSNPSRPPGPVALRIFRAFALTAMLPVAAFAALLLSLGIEHRISITLPDPTGPFAVGRAIYDWSDDATLDRLAPIPGTKRELLVWVWYPAVAAQSAATDDYLPVAFRTAMERHRGVLLSKFLTRDLSKVHGHSLGNAEVSPQQLTYPVVMLRAGASLEVANYSTLAEDLASHGYVVVGFDAPYRTSIVAFPDGRTIRRLPQNDPERCLDRIGQQQEDCANRLLRAWTADMAFVLDRLAQFNASDPSGKFTTRLDMNRVGVFGHSFWRGRSGPFLPPGFADARPASISTGLPMEA